MIDVVRRMTIAIVKECVNGVHVRGPLITRKAPGLERSDIEPVCFTETVYCELAEGHFFCLGILGFAVLGNMCSQLFRAGRGPIVPPPPIRHDEEDGVHAAPVQPSIAAELI